MGREGLLRVFYELKKDAYSLTNVAIGDAKNDWEVELQGVGSVNILWDCNKFCVNNLFDEEYVDLM